MTSLQKDNWLKALHKLRGREGRAVVHGDYPEAAVLVPMLEVKGEPSVLLTKRAPHLRIHAGESAFPGGKRDEQDASLLATALREAEEEIGLAPAHFELLFTLDQRLTRTGIKVTPFVGLIPSALELTPNPDEIEVVFTVPLEFFCDRRNLVVTEIEYQGEFFRTPRFYYQGRDIWGMTARTLMDLVNEAFAAELSL